MKLTNLQKKLLWPQVYNEFKEYEKKLLKFKIFKVMKIMFKIIFSQLLLHITQYEIFKTYWYSIIEYLLNNRGHHEK